MVKKVHLISTLLIGASLQVSAQTALKFGNTGGPTGSGTGTGAGTSVSNKAITLEDAGTSSAYSPATTVTYSLSNQQFTPGDVEGISTANGLSFGHTTNFSSNTVMGTVPYYDNMDAISSPTNSMFTACASCAGGIDVTTDYSVSLFTCSDALISSSTGDNIYALNARVYYADLTITFNRPVSNPILQIVGLGGFNSYPRSGKEYAQGFATEFDLKTTGLSLLKLDGNAYLSVDDTSIRNSATRMGVSSVGSIIATGLTHYAASGSVQIKGNNITSVTFKVYLKGDGGVVTNGSGTVVSAASGVHPLWAKSSLSSLSSADGVIGDVYYLSTSLQKPVTVSGNVFHDINGGNVNGSSAAALPSGLKANLIDTNGKVVMTTNVAAGGTFSFSEVYEGQYTVQVSTNAGTPGSAAPAIALPSGWANTGEFNGTPNTGNDGTKDSKSIIFTVAAADVTNVNFGIEQPPAAGTVTLASQVNPGGTTGITVTSSFSGTDPVTSTVTSLRITTFPTNATSITIGSTTYTSTSFPAGGVTVATSAAGVPTSAISVDPIDGAVTVAIPYKTIDGAGLESAAAGAVNIPLTTVTVSGNVFNDVDGLSDATVDGTGTNAGGLTAILVNSSGNVVANATVSAAGAYDFSSVNGGTYTVVLSTTAGTVGSAAPSASLPSTWSNTGENNSASAGDDGTINGTSASFTVSATDVTNVNFGIEQPPTAGTVTLTSQPNPGGTTNITVTSNFSGTDPVTSTIDSLRITSFPTNATSITIGSTTYTSSSFPSGGVTVPTNAAGVPTPTISVDPVDGAVTVAIPYKTKDAAGLESAVAGTVNVPLTASGVVVSGNVYNDVDGLSDATVDGTGTNAGGLTAILVNSSGNVVANATVSAAGAYDFSGVAAGTYTVRLSTTAGTVGSAAPSASLPSGWSNTGENNSTSAGDDGSVNGTSASFTVSATDVTNVNFGIEQPPAAGTATLAIQVNPGGTTSVAVTSNFSGTDPVTSTVDSLRITSFPTNATSITIGATTYTSSSFPVGGVTVPTSAGGVPTPAISVDPVDGAVTVVISYKTKDAAGLESAVAGAVNVPFGVVVSGNVYNDVGGLSDATVNGTGTNAGGLTAILVNSSGNVVANATVSAVGTYSYPAVGAGDYTVRLSTTAGIVGGAAPSASLPSGWSSTGENNSTSAGSDGTVNGTSASFTVATTDVTNINFGIEQPPAAGTVTLPSQANPGGTTSITVTSEFSGTDPVTSTVDSLRITAFPTNVTSITIGSTTYTSSSFPSGGVTVPTNAAGVPTPAISIDPIDGSVTVAIPYKTKDAAGLESSLGAVNIPLTGSALPLHLLSFAGSTANCTNSIMWTTAIESNMQLIELLRSEDGRQFVSIHKEQPKGMSYNQYSYADEFEGDAYYKLRMVDNDHTFEYSSTIAIKGCASSEPIQIYPSPATNQLKIEVKSTGASNYYQIMDMQGRIVMKGQLEAATVNNIDISNLSAGIYMVKVSVQSGAFSTKQIQVTK